MAILRQGQAKKCLKCGGVFWMGVPEDKSFINHKIRCHGKFQCGTRTIYKYCPSGGAKHNEQIITRGVTEVAKQTHCPCGAELRERDVFSPSEP